MELLNFYNKLLYINTSGESSHILQELSETIFGFELSQFDNEKFLNKLIQELSFFLVFVTLSVLLN